MPTSESTFEDAFHANEHLPELLARGEGGEQITITRDGAPVARLVPVGPVSTIESRQDAIRAIRELASRIRLAPFTIRDLITEGRK
jgi:prevent-host-death family protein